jgi:hypothetical protein
VRLVERAVRAADGGAADFFLIDRDSCAWYARGYSPCGLVGEGSVNFQDRRLWYIVLAVVVVLIIIYAMWPAGEVAPPAATQ